MSSAGFEIDVEAVGFVFGAVVAPPAGLLRLSRAADSRFHVVFGVHH
jgi:hypothetical protein